MDEKRDSEGIFLKLSDATAFSKEISYYRGYFTAKPLKKISYSILIF
jgi:hypothetical protein